MKVGDKIITGVFKFTPGITYTKNDLILSNGELRLVNQEEITPESEIEIEFSTIPYVDTVCYSSDNPNGPLNVSAFRSLLESTIAGVNDRFILNIDIDELNGNSINARLSTGIFSVNLRSNELTTLPISSTYILKVYRVNDNKIIQEWLDFINLNIWTRITEDGGTTWKEYALISDNSLNSVQSDILSTIAKYKQQINALKHHGFIQYRVSAPEGQSLSEITLNTQDLKSFTVLLSKLEDTKAKIGEIKSLTFDLSYYSIQRYKDDYLELAVQLEGDNMIKFRDLTPGWSVISVICQTPIYHE